MQQRHDDEKQHEDQPQQQPGQQHQQKQPEQQQQKQQQPGQQQQKQQQPGQQQQKCKRASKQVIDQQLVEKLLATILVAGNKLKLSGRDGMYKHTGEIFGVEVIKLLGVGGFGAAWLVKLLRHVPVPLPSDTAAVTEEAATGEVAKDTATAAAGGELGARTAATTGESGRGKAIAAGAAARGTPAAATAPTRAGGKSSSSSTPLRKLPELMVLKLALPHAALTPKQQEQTTAKVWLLQCKNWWQREWKVMTACVPCPYVLGCYGLGIIKTPAPASELLPWLLLEYAEYGTLQEQLGLVSGQEKGLAPEQARQVVFEVIQGLKAA